jgi:hypothetical protein
MIKYGLVIVAVFMLFTGTAAGVNDNTVNESGITTLDELATTLTSPSKLLEWMKANISYGWPGWPDMNTWTYLSPQQVYANKQGDCTGQSSFEKYILAKHNYDVHLLWVDRPNNSDHAVCYWRLEDKTYYYLEHAFWAYKGIYGPFSTVEAIGAHMYRHMVEYDGQDVGYSLWDLDHVPNGLSWIDFLNARRPYRPPVDSSFFPSIYLLLDRNNN